MEHRFLGICIFFIGILIYLYKKRNTEIREHFNMKTIAEAKNPLLKNPEYLLPSNNTATDPGSEDGKDYYEESKIRPTLSDSKVVFDAGNINKEYMLNVIFSKAKEENQTETEDSMLARFMIPLLWQATKNQIEEFNKLSKDIQEVNKILRAANKKMVDINVSVDNIGQDAIAKKRSNDFDFKKF